MTAQIYIHKCEVSLCVCSAQNSRGSKGGGGELGVVWDVEGIGGFACETLSSAPGHVLDHEKGTIGDEDHV